VESQKKKCAGYDSRSNCVIEYKKGGNKKSASISIYAFLSSSRCGLPDPHRTEAKRASQMFGRIRASTSSLETLEGSPSKILKDDTFSIYGTLSLSQFA